MFIGGPVPWMGWSKRDAFGDESDYSSISIGGGVCITIPLVMAMTEAVGRRLV